MLRVLLDSGSGGDLLFEKAKSIRSVPYYPRAIPQVWHTSNGQGGLELLFPEFSDSMQAWLNQNIMSYECDAPTPSFDLVIGTETMSRLGIVLDFKTKMVDLDE